MTSSQILHLALQFDPLRDKSYQATRSGRSVVDFLTWKRIGQAAERTLDQYERDLARGCLMFPQVGFDEWTDSELLHVAASFPAKSRRVRMAAYASWFKWGIRTKRLTGANPCDQLPDIKQHGIPPIEIFTDGEIARLTGLPSPDGVLMQILFDSGIRKDEARRLQVDGFLRDKLPGHLHVHGKGDKWRTIPCTLALASKLDELITLDGLQPSDYLWYRRWNNARGSKGIKRVEPIGHTTFHYWWGRCLEDAGVTYRNLHVTRHTFATRYLRRGGRIETLSLLLGHESIKTTFDIYAHLDLVDLSAEMARLFDSVQ